MENIANNRKYKIPQDILMDILRILFRNKVSYNITGIKEKENSLFLTVDYQKTPHAEQVQENLEAILNDYCNYMKGIITDNTLCMDDDVEDDY